MYRIARNVGGEKLLWRISKILHWQKNLGELPTLKIKQKFRPPAASGGPTVKLWQISTNIKKLNQDYLYSVKDSVRVAVFIHMTIPWTVLLQH